MFHLWRVCFLYLCVGNLCMVTGGANLGRIGVITNRERHPGSFDVVHVKDSTGNSFATRLSNIFVIGKVRKKCTFSADSCLMQSKLDLFHCLFFNCIKLT